MKTRKYRKNIGVPQCAPTYPDYKNSKQGMLTSSWGPPLWHFLHTMSFAYPIKPSLLQKKHYLRFMQDLEHVLPCPDCRTNYHHNMPINLSHLRNRNTFTRYIYDLHESVNHHLGKQSGLSYKQVRDEYERFRATTKRKK